LASKNPYSISVFAQFIELLGGKFRLVVGETAVVDDDVSLLQDVTLGGTGKESRDRHPKIRRGAMIDAGAKILGNIEIGSYARIAAGALVLQAVPPKATVAGNPAKIVKASERSVEAQGLDQILKRLLRILRICDLTFRSSQVNLSDTVRMQIAERSAVSRGSAASKSDRDWAPQSDERVR
jgi:acyl-[acyl carrier protein]--UDP-N-acetylglucosamine O-acyltransferase